MKITLKYLKSIGTCKESIEAYREYKEPKQLRKVFRLLMNKDNNYFWVDKESYEYHTLDWASWLICKLLNKKQQIQYTIYAVKQVIKIFEGKYPDDDRPRKAIQAAEKCLKNPNQKNKNAAADAAGNAYSAAVTTSDYATYAAAYAGYTAAYGKSHIADAAITYATKAYAYSKNKLRIKIIKYGLKLLEV